MGPSRIPRRAMGPRRIPRRVRRRRRRRISAPNGPNAMARSAALPRPPRRRRPLLLRRALTRFAMRRAIKLVSGPIATAAPALRRLRALRPRRRLRRPMYSMISMLVPLPCSPSAPWAHDKQQHHARRNREQHRVTLNHINDTAPWCQSARRQCKRLRFG